MTAKKKSITSILNKAINITIALALHFYYMKLLTCFKKKASKTLILFLIKIPVVYIDLIYKIRKLNMP